MLFLSGCSSRYLISEPSTIIPVNRTGQNVCFQCLYPQPDYDTAWIRSGGGTATNRNNAFPETIDVYQGLLVIRFMNEFITADGPAGLTRMTCRSVDFDINLAFDFLSDG